MSPFLGSPRVPSAWDVRPVLVEVAPARALGAGPVLAFLAPGLVGEDAVVSLRASDNSEFGFSLSGPADEIASAAAALRARFGEAVLVGDLEPLA